MFSRFLAAARVLQERQLPKLCVMPCIFLATMPRCTTKLTDTRPQPNACPTWANGEKGNIMNAVEKIKVKHNMDMDALLRALAPAMEKNVKRRRKEEAAKAEAYRRRKADEARKARVNMTLAHAGIPLRVL